LLAYDRPDEQLAREARQAAARTGVSLDSGGKRPNWAGSRAIEPLDDR
jgi:hypothetical protein